MLRVTGFLKDIPDLMGRGEDLLSGKTGKTGRFFMNVTGLTHVNGDGRQ